MDISAALLAGSHPNAERWKNVQYGMVHAQAEIDARHVEVPWTEGYVL